MVTQQEIDNKKEQLKQEQEMLKQQQKELDLKNAFLNLAPNIQYENVSKKDILNIAVQAYQKENTAGDFAESSHGQADFIIGSLLLSDDKEVQTAALNSLHYIRHGFYTHRGYFGEGNKEPAAIKRISEAMFNLAAEKFAQSKKRILSDECVDFVSRYAQFIPQGKLKEIPYGYEGVGGTTAMWFVEMVSYMNRETSTYDAEHYGAVYNDCFKGTLIPLTNPNSEKHAELACRYVEHLKKHHPEEEFIITDAQKRILGKFTGIDKMKFYKMASKYGATEIQAELLKEPAIKKYQDGLDRQAAIEKAEKDKQAAIVAAKERIAKKIFNLYCGEIPQTKKDVDRLKTEVDARLQDIDSLIAGQEKFFTEQEKALAEREEKLFSEEARLSARDRILQMKEDRQFADILAVGPIEGMSLEEKEKLFNHSKEAFEQSPRLREVALSNMCQVYVDSEGENKKAYLKDLYEIRKVGNTNAEKREMARTFERVINRDDKLKADENLQALAKIDIGIVNPTKAVKKQIEY